MNGDSESLTLWKAAIALIGILMAIVGALLGAVFRSFNKRFESVESRTLDGKLAEHLGMDRERERGWWDWRGFTSKRIDELEKRFEAHEREDRITHADVEVLKARINKGIER
jgi:hypothetical protein